MGLLRTMALSAALGLACSAAIGEHQYGCKDDEPANAPCPLLEAAKEVNRVVDLQRVCAQWREAPRNPFKRIGRRLHSAFMAEKAPLDLIVGYSSSRAALLSDVAACLGTDTSHSQHLVKSDVPEGEFLLLDATNFTGAQYACLIEHASYVEPNCNSMANVDDIRAFGKCQDDAAETIGLTGLLLTRQGTGLKVAVLDSGISNHSNLVSAVERWSCQADSATWCETDFIDGDRNPDWCDGKTGTDCKSHGTHMAGTIAGQMTLASKHPKRYAVAPDARVVPLRVLASKPAATAFLAQSVYMSERSGSRIANASWNMAFNSRTLYNAIKRSNVLFVAAAHNDARFPAIWAPGLPNMIAVVPQSNRGRTRQLSSSDSEFVDAIAAPSECIYSTSRPEREFEYRKGVSSAAAYVSGAAALIWSQPRYTSCTPSEMKQLLYCTSAPKTRGRFLDVRFLGKQFPQCAPGMGQLPACAGR